ncbi:MAG TPA: hypothetical protein VGX69_00565 [Solirubrobacteraceae bacterium]|nr:hypothetical protein [Solirubrobacteraceae bacterium]
MPTRDELDLKVQLAGPEMLGAMIEQSRGQEQVCMGLLGALRRGARQAELSGGSTTWREASVILQRNGEIRIIEARIGALQEARRVMQSFVVGRSV